MQDGTIATNTVVNLTGVWVTAIHESGFFAQELPGGQYSGVFVYVDETGPDISGLAIGDLVDIEGVVVEFNDITELDASNGAVTEIGVAAPIPTPDVVTLADLAADVGEPWEGVYVRVAADPISVVSLPGFDEFMIDDGTADGWVDNYLYNLIADGMAEFPDFGIGATFTAVQGPVNFTFDSYKLAPRFAADLEGYLPSANPTLDINDLLPGDLVVTEIMYDPNVCNDNNCEWIEIYNASGASVDLNGLRIQDAIAATGTVSVSLIVEPDGYVWLGRGPMANWGYTNPAQAYYGPDPAFNNDDDMVVILNDTEILDQTHTYVDGGMPAGRSFQLDSASIDASANDTPANWCVSMVDFGDGDLGSPGAANEACF